MPTTLLPLTRVASLSENKKLGFGVAVTYRPVGTASNGEGTCPDTCPLMNNGCYAQKRLVKLQQTYSRTLSDPLEKLLARGANLVRFNISGDFFEADGSGGWKLDVGYFTTLVNFAKNHKKITFWCYCHDVSKLVDAGYSYLADTIPANFHIVASCDSMNERDFAKAHGFRTARVINDFEEKLDGETFCPYDLDLRNGMKTPRTVCSKCTLCFNKKHQHDIAFLKH